MTTPWNKKGIAIIPESQPHFIDHLAPIASMMDIPLVFLEEQCYDLGKRYYPNVRCELEDVSLFSLEQLVKNYDVSFMAEPWSRDKIQKELSALEARYQKKMLNVFCPHGFSDKGFYFDLCYRDADLYLVYGDNLIDLLKERGIWERINPYVITGNNRYTYYKQNAEFYEEVFEREIQSQFDKKRPIIFYAPTWNDLEQSGSLEDACGYIYEGLPADYNLLVKVHPRFELDDPVGYYSIVSQYQHKKNVYFLSDFPPIFALLAHIDIYIGDTSSIGYDFLAFDKPMFLLNKFNRDIKTDRRLFLFQCATEIKPEQYSDIYKIIEQSLPSDAEKMSPLRKKMWEYSFGHERPLEEIRAAIIEESLAIENKL
jgi:hypothetical protein